MTMDDTETDWAEEHTYKEKFTQAKAVRESVKAAAQGVQDGMEAEDRQCWACGARPVPGGGKYSRCSGCHVAYYW